VIIDYGGGDAVSRRAACREVEAKGKGTLKTALVPEWLDANALKTA
jgi:hypothetical protein